MATNGVVNGFENQILLFDGKIGLVLVVKIDQLR